MELDTIGIDLGKTVFRHVGLNRAGEVTVRRKFSRTQLLRFTADLRVRLVGMEACGGSQVLGRSLGEQGHEVRLMRSNLERGRTGFTAGTDSTRDLTMAEVAVPQVSSQG